MTQLNAQKQERTQTQRWLTHSRTLPSLAVHTRKMRSDLKDAAQGGGYATSANDCVSRG
jgi:hypothetical protein